MKKSLPKEIYVTIEEQGTRDEYLQVYLTPDEAAEIGAKRLVGKYVLQSVVRVETKIVLS